MTKIHICSRTTAERLSYHPEFKESLIISITNVGSEKATFNPAGENDVIRFEFDDLVDPENPNAPKDVHLDLLARICDGEYHWNAFASRFGSIKGMLRQHIIVHCEAGVSRSAAVALALGAKLFGIKGAKDHFKDEAGWICPNELIAGELDNRLGFDGKLLALSEWFVSESLKRHNMEESWEETI